MQQRARARGLNEAGQHVGEGIVLTVFSTSRPVERRQNRSADGALRVTGLDCLAIGAIACAHDITVFELAAQGRSLEEAFFDLTRDETDYRASQLTGATQGA